MLKEASNEWPARRWGFLHHSIINSTNNVNKLALQEVLGDLEQRHQLRHAWAPAPGNGIQL